MTPNCCPGRGVAFIVLALLGGVVVGYGFTQPSAPGPAHPVYYPTTVYAQAPQAPAANPNEDLFFQPGAAPGGMPQAPDLNTLSFDQLVERVTLLRKRMAELEQMEQAAVQQLRERFREQKEKLAKLGVSEEPAVAPGPVGVPIPGGLAAPPAFAPGVIPGPIGPPGSLRPGTNSLPSAPPGLVPPGQ